MESTNVVPKRVTLTDFAFRNNPGNRLVLIKSLLIPVTSYSICTGHPGASSVSLVVSALIDKLSNTLYDEPSMAPLLSQLLDKLLLGASVASLAYMKRLPARVVSNVYSRDVLLSVGSIVHRYLAFPHPIEWDKFFDTTHFTSFGIVPTYFSRVGTSMTTLMVVMVLCNWTFKPPVARALVSFLPKAMDFCSMFSFIEYFLPPAIPKPRKYGVLSSLFI